LTVTAVIKPQMDQVAPATVLTIFEVLMEILESVGRKSQCCETLHEQKLAI